MRSVMFQALLLCAICPIVLLSSAVTGPGADELRLLQVTIPDRPPASAILGGTLMLPCFVSLSLPLPTTSSLGRLAMLNMPRIKWSMLSSGRETEILVARGERVKISESYRHRASLPNYASSPADLTLQLDGLRHNDTGFYRCEVQQGLEDAHDLAQVKVKGVVFHYRHASSRYALSFEDAKNACGDIGAQIATPEQLLAAYHSGYEQCDAGWLADGSVRYPIHLPREGCYGDMESLPGVRNYGMMDPDELYDVYCYIENIHGEVFHGSTSERFTLDEAKAYCEQQGAELANTGQLYAAWNDGLNHCSPGWLADGSVRYPIVTPRERCGGSEPGVKTVYRYSNQTGFPEPPSRYDVYCFRGNIDSRTVGSVGYLATEPEDIGQDIVTLADHQEEFSLGHVSEHTENEAQGAVETLSISSEPTQTKPITTQPDMVYTTNCNILTTPTQTEPTQSSLQESSTNPVVTESVPAIYQEASYNQPIIVEVQDMENGTVDELKNHNHTQYEPTPESSLEPGEQVEYRTHTESKQNTTVDNLEPSLEPELQDTVEAKPFQNMSDTKLDDQEIIHEVENLTDIEAIGGNTTVAREFDENLNHTTKSTYSGTSEGSTREMTTASSNKTALLVTDSKDSDLHSSPESTTESSLFAVLSQSTQKFEPSQDRTLVLSLSSTVDPLEKETGHTSAESYIVSSSSATNKSDHSLKEIITPTHQAEKQMESIDGSGDDVLSLTLLTTPVPHLLGTSVFQKAPELEGSSSQEVEISISESTAPFEVEVVEQVKQEGLGAAPVLHTTARPIAEAETTASQYKSTTEDESSGKEESSGGEYLVTEYPTLPHQHATPIVTNPFKSTDLPLLNITESTEVNESESRTSNITMEVPVLHHIALTPGWDTTTTPTPAQESQAEVEFISDAPLLRENPNSSTGSDTTAVSITEKPKHAENSTFAVAIDDEEHESDLTTIANLGNSKEEDKVTAPTQYTSPPIRPVEAMPVRTSISDGCVENPCANGGTCVDNDTGVECLCLPTYGGEFCKEDLEKCEPGWDKFQGNCYKYFSKRQSWEVAEQQCRLSGGHLVSIMSPEEQDFINGKYKEYQWTGLNDRTIEGDFRWSDGNPLLYENWYNAQPDSYFLSGEDCVVMVWHDDGRWSDVPCNYHLSYTCKKGTTFCSQPPLVVNAKQFGKQRLRYEINAQVRYYCQEGFVPRYNPIIRCQSNGQWEEPQITCTEKPDEPNDGQITVPTVRSKDVFVKDTATEKATSQWSL